MPDNGLIVITGGQEEAIAGHPFDIAYPVGMLTQLNDIPGFQVPDDRSLGRDCRTIKY